MRQLRQAVLPGVPSRGVPEMRGGGGPGRPRDGRGRPGLTSGVGPEAECTPVALAIAPHLGAAGFDTTLSDWLLMCYYC